MAAACTPTVLVGFKNADLRGGKGCTYLVVCNVDLLDHDGGTGSGSKGVQRCLGALENFWPGLESQKNDFGGCRGLGDGSPAYPNAFSAGEILCG